MSQLPNNSSYFPADLPTPNSYGQTYHKHNFETDGLSNHLNINNDASGNWTGEIGGFNFSTINSTLTEPISLATIDISGITIDKSIAGQPILINLPNLTQSTNVVVVFASPINVAPWNIVGVGNPVQVLQNTANMQVGITYYLSGLSTQLGQITTNPDGTGIIDCTDLVSLPQPILTWESGQFGPATTQTVNLYETLTINTQSDESILSATDLTFNGVSIISNEMNNSKSISKLQYANPINIANSPAIYGTLPSSPPMIPTTNAINTGFNGWYYRNISSAYNNISWSTGFQPSSYIVSNLKGIYFTFVSLTTTSKPFISVYTLPPTAPNFYKSRRSFVPAIAPATITAGIPYIYYYMFDNSYPTPFKYCHQAVPLSLSAVNPVGAFAPNELLYFMSVNTNTISPANTEELIVAESGVIIDDGTGTLIQPFSFNSANVYSPNSYRAVQKGAGTLTPTISDNGTTYIATANFTISNAGLSGVPAGFFIIVQGTTTDRTITYNTGATKTVHTNTGTTNASQVIFYWLGDTFVAYN